jgi:hypothetical protein
MAHDSNIKHFTALDIERYHKGLLSPREQHDLEKAALDDPFLADALEGYSVPGVNVAADIASLKKQLAEKTGETGKVVPMSAGSGRSFRWLRAAVLIIGIAGAGILTYQLAFNKNDKNDLPIAEAKDYKKESIPQTITTAPAAVDSTKDKQVSAQGTLKLQDTALAKGGYWYLNRATVKPVDMNGSKMEGLSSYSKADTDKTLVDFFATTPAGEKIEFTTNAPAKEKDYRKDAGFGKLLTDSAAIPGRDRAANPVASGIDDDINKLEKKNIAKAKATIPAPTYDEEAKRRAAAGSDKKLADQQLQTERIAVFNSNARPTGNSDNRSAQPGAVANKQTAKEGYYQLNSFRGQVLDNNNNPLPFANVTNVQDGIGTYADAKGFFNLTSTADSVLNVNIKVLGYSNLSNYKLQSANLYNNQVRMQEDRSLSVQVVEKNKRANEARKSANTMKLAGEPEPEDGWDNYYSYLDNNANAPDEALKAKENASGVSVDISFEVNKYGEPVKFKVERSVCPKCNEEAIRLIKEGPKWKRKAKNGRITVTISF